MQLCNIYGIFRNESETVVHSVTAVSTVLSSLAFITNGLLLAALVQTKQTKSPTMLIVYLAIVDMLHMASMAVTMPYSIATKYDENFDKDCIVTTISTFVTGFLSILSPMMTTIVVIDRYNHMDPNREETCLLKMLQRPYSIAVAVGLIFFCIQYPAVFFIGAYFNVPMDVYRLIIAVIFAVLIVLVSFLYIRGYLKVRRFVDESSIYQNNAGVVCRPDYVRRLFKTVLLLLSVLMATFLPATLGNLLISVCNILGIKNHFASSIVYHFTLPSVLIGPFLNPLILFRYNQEAWLWLRSFLRCKQAVSDGLGQGEV